MELGLMEVSVGAAAGLMVKFNALDVGNPGVATVIGTVPESKSKLAGTRAVKSVELTKSLAKGVPFHCTVAPELKFEPETNRVNAPLPEIAAGGESNVSTGGDAGTMVKTMALLGGAPGLTIVILAVPGDAMSEAGTLAVNCEELT